MTIGGAVRDSWEQAEAYEVFMGRWSRLVAPAFLDWLDVGSGLRWLDVGAGTGALSGAIIDRVDPVQVVGVDSSEDHVSLARRLVDDRRAQFGVADAHHLGLAGSFDVAVAGLVLNFLDPVAAAVVAMRRAVIEAGVVAAYVWDYSGGMDLLGSLWTAAVDIDPAAAELDESFRFSGWTQEHLAALWHDAGLRTVRTTTLEVTMEFAGFDDYWQPFLGGSGPAPTYVASLTERQRHTLRERVRVLSPIAPDGSLTMHARALAVAGRA